ncbi:MAG: Dehydrogenases (flavoproteins) [Phormidesmis priestleyi Ana]|uniref:Dehydrogenases (Flavoproteins) n=1 Tax=Phormidesmis priestleyi Ana TaxID=1666911 RepID=A0A0P8BXL2_9CYAN|nr:MAG: Dehydrogenases (flavoproteins) [Phormidesmis priestleyi Ana]
MLDCIIVGGGPAGSSAAYHLSKAGRSVLLLEKSALPRYKPCSGAVSPSVAQWFDFDFAPAIDSQIKRVRYTWKLGDAIDAQLETDPIWSVRREVFDQFLIDQAKAQGAEVKDQTVVTGIAQTGDGWQVNTAHGSFFGRYIIAADGAKGPMAGWLGFPAHKVREAGVLEINTEAPVQDGAFSFEFGLAKNGCLWSFPKQQGYSIGVSSFIGDSLKDLKTPLQKYAPEFGATFEDGILHTHPLKLWDGNWPLHGERSLLVGEAAAIVDPLTAEGIRPAMFSGVMAAKAIDQALNGNEQALAGYSQTIHENWGADMQWAQRIAAVFFRVPKIGYRVGITRPTATKRLGQILAGEISYADIANRVIKRISTSFIPGMGK